MSLSLHNFYSTEKSGRKLGIGTPGGRGAAPGGSIPGGAIPGGAMPGGPIPGGPIGRIPGGIGPIGPIGPMGPIGPIGPILGPPIPGIGGLIPGGPPIP